jgi:hypoxanthine phosphoribosyltransferase
MENQIINIRNWVRTNGTMSEDGKSITYDCIELEKTIKEALMQSAVIGQSKQLLDFVRWQNIKSNWISFPESIIPEYEKYLKYMESQKKKMCAPNISKSFYCKPFTEDGMMTDDEKCKKQCDDCKTVC